MLFLSPLLVGRLCLSKNLPEVAQCTFMETPLHEEKDLSKSALQVLLWTEADTGNTNDMQISVQDRFPISQRKEESDHL